MTTIAREMVEERVRRMLVNDFVRKEVDRAGFGGLSIQRTPLGTHVRILAERPGIVIGRKGSEADSLRAGLGQITGNNAVQLNIQEIKEPELDAALIAQGVADQLAGRVAFRRAMKRAVQ